ECGHGFPSSTATTDVLYMTYDILALAGPVNPGRWHNFLAVVLKAAAVQEFRFPQISVLPHKDRQNRLHKATLIRSTPRTVPTTSVEKRPPQHRLGAQLQNSRLGLSCQVPWFELIRRLFRPVGRRALRRQARDSPLEHPCPQRLLLAERHQAGLVPQVADAGDPLGAQPAEAL